MRYDPQSAASVWLVPGLGCIRCPPELTQPIVLCRNAFTAANTQSGYFEQTISYVNWHGRIGAGTLRTGRTKSVLIRAWSRCPRRWWPRVSQSIIYQVPHQPRPKVTMVAMISAAPECFKPLTAAVIDPGVILRDADVPCYLALTSAP